MITEMATIPLKGKGNTTFKGRGSAFANYPANHSQAVSGMQQLAWDK